MGRLKILSLKSIPSDEWWYIQLSLDVLEPADKAEIPYSSNVPSIKKWLLSLSRRSRRNRRTTTSPDTGKTCLEIGTAVPD